MTELDRYPTGSEPVFAPGFMGYVGDGDAVRFPDLALVREALLRRGAIAW